MEKGGVAIVLILVFSIFFFGFVSANSIGDWFKRITGFSIAENTGLSAYYKFEDNVQDSAGSNHGTNNGAVFIDGKVGKALSFDGVNDYVDIGNGSILKLGGGDFAYAAWIKPKSAKFNQRVISDERASQYNHRALKLVPVFISGVSSPGYKVQFWCRDSMGNTILADITTIFTDNNWHYVVGVRNGSTGYIYVDGNLGGSATNPATGSCDGNARTFIGGRDAITSPLLFNGSIDEVRIYNRALSASEVKELYQLDIKPQNLTCANFGYNEGIVGNCCDLQCTKYDLSGCMNTTRSCVDKDGGISYFIASSVSTGYSSMKGPVCPTSEGLPSSPSLGGGATFIDRCELDSLLKEYFCQANNEEGFFRYNCTNGCFEGACIPDSTLGGSSGGGPGGKTICTDSDGGLNKNVYGWTNFTAGSFSLKHEDACALVSSYDSDGIPGGWQGVMSCSGDNCYVEEAFCRTDENGSFIDSDADQLIKCSSGCSNGACLEPVRTEECTDSDGGLMYDKKGIASGTTYDGVVYSNAVDKCTIFDANGQRDVEECVGEGCRVTEWWCDDKGILRVDYNSDCSNGCQDGMCQEAEPQICQSLFDKLSITDEIYHGYILGDVETGEEESDYWGGKAKLTLYDFHNQENGKGIFIATIVLEKDKLIEETPWFKKIIEDFELISGDTVFANGQINKVYIIYNEYTGKAMFWYNKNVLTYVYLFNTEFEDIYKIKNIEEFINSLQDNEFESIVDYSDKDFQIIREIMAGLINYCPSTIDSSECVPQWERKIEPVVCPPHGVQKILIRDRYGCNTRVIEREKSCSPGICSGCYIPRWIGYESRGNNVCIPYGIRIANEQTDRERLRVGDSDEDAILRCVDENSAEVTIINPKTNFEQTLELNERESYTISEEYFGEEIRFRVDKISCSGADDSNGYVDITALDEFNAYCDIDGRMKEQQKKDTAGNWAKCQNNYECDSNLCSGGECVEINDAIRKAKGIMPLFIRIICRIGHVFNEDNYNVCVGKYLGYSPAS